MKRTILLLTIVLSSCTLFSQQRQVEDIVKGKKVGDIVKGRNVKYEVIEDMDFFILRNVKKQDAIKRKANIRVPEAMRIKIYDIVYNHLLPEELSRVIKEKAYSFEVGCIMNKKLRIQEVIFAIDKEEHFWLNFSVDRLYSIEKNIIKSVKMDERHRRWITKIENENQYFSISIQFQVLREMQVEKEKEALENAKAKIQQR